VSKLTERIFAKDPEERPDPVQALTDGQHARVKRANLWLTGTLSVILFLLLLVLLFAYAQIVPAHPLEVNDSSLITRVACPLGPVRVESNYTLGDYNIGEVTSISEWTRLGDEQEVQPGGEDVLSRRELEAQASVNAAAPSPFVRTAPVRPGLWVLKTTTETSYSLYGVPRIQTASFSSGGSLKVIELTDERCQEM